MTEGHPDKLCDQVSDAVLDAILEDDPAARVACETCTTTGLVMVMGEITTQKYGGHTSDRASHDPRRRIHRLVLRVRLPVVRDRGIGTRAVAGHIDGRHTLA